MPCSVGKDDQIQGFGWFLWRWPFPHGAPFAYKTTKICRLGVAACDHVRQGCLVADHPDLWIVYLDPRDDGAQPAVAGPDVAIVQLAAHQRGEGVEFLRLDLNLRAAGRWMVASISAFSF